MNTNTTPLSDRLAALAATTTDPELAAFLATAARRAADKEAKDAERDAELAEWYRQPTAEELSSIQGLRSFLQRYHPAQTGPAALPGILEPVAAALGTLAQSSADVDATGKPTPGRGPIALALNMAKSEVSRAIAVSRSTEYEHAGIFLAVARGFLAGLIEGQTPAVGSG